MKFTLAFFFFLVFGGVCFVIDVDGLKTGLLLSKSGPGFLYTADPNALVVNDTVYVFTSHDATSATSWNTMADYVLITSESDGSWTNHGVVFEPKKNPLLKNYKMYAPGAYYNYNDSYFYLFFPYLPLGRIKNSCKVGIARTKTPTDKSSWEFYSFPEIYIFDPALIKDPSTGNVYIYGNTYSTTFSNYMLIGQMNSNLSNVKQPLIKTNVVVTEAVFCFYRNNRFYIFARKQRNRNDALFYWMTDSPLNIVGDPIQFTPNMNSAPSQGSVIEYHGKWYLFYHTGKENEGSKYRRSVCVDELRFYSDGKIIPVTYSCRY